MTGAPNAGYYEVAAQIIAILFLAMVIGEARFEVRRDVKPIYGLIVVLFAVFIMLAGEIAALRVLLLGKGTEAEKFLVRLSLASGMGFVVVEAAFATWGDLNGSKSELTIWVRVALGLSGSLAAAGAFIALSS